MTFFSNQTRVHHRPSADFLNLSMDFNAAPSGTARGTEVVIPDNASPAVRAAAERYNQQVAAFASRNGIADYPVRGVRTRSENGRGVPHTIHAEPFFNSDTAMQEAIKKNPAEFAAIYRDAFAGLGNVRAIAPHGVGRDRGAASSIFGDETTFGEMIANAGLGTEFTLPELQGGGSTDTLAGGLSISPNRQPDNLPQGGLLQMQSNTPAPATGLFAKLFPDATREKQDNVAMALSGLSMNPNQGMMRSIQGRQDERRLDRREAKAQQVQARQGNRTAEWLASQPGGARYAEAILSGVPTNQVLSMYREANKAQGPAKGVVVNGQLVNPTTGEQMGDYRDQGNGTSEAEQEIARLESVGIPRPIAIKIKEGVFKTVTDPTTREAVVIDLASGKPVYRVGMGGAQEQPEQPSTPTPQQATGPDAADGFGLGGIVKGGINSVVDFAGGDVPFAGVQETQSDFAVLREGLVNDIASGYGRQPPSWLMKNIQDLTPQAGGMQGAGAAQSKLGALKRSFEGEMATVQRQLEGQISPSDRAALSQREAAIQSAMDKVDQALGRFGQGGTGNTTQSGVQWRVKP